jgi:hypothetical protein
MNIECSDDSMNIQNIEDIINKHRSVDFAENKEILALYIDTAKTFSNLGAGALGLTITLRNYIFDSRVHGDITSPMIASWFCYLVAIFASALYQYFAVRFLDSFSRSPDPTGWCKLFERNPGWMYAVMLVFFFLGSGLVIVAAGDLLAVGNHVTH